MDTNKREEDSSISEHSITIKDMFTELYPAKESWFNIGLQLDMDIQELNGINCNIPNNGKGERLCNMLDARIKQRQDLTWENIAVALENRTVGQEKLAGEIRNKYIKPQSVGEDNTKDPATTTPTVSHPGSELSSMSPPPTAQTPISTSVPTTQPSCRETLNTNNSQSETDQSNQQGESSNPRKRPGHSPQTADSKHPKKSEYCDEKMFINFKVVEKYKCIHCKKIPTIFYRCQCTKPNTEKGKLKYTSNAGLSCEDCRHEPCTTCGSKDQYVLDKDTKANIQKVKVHCPQGCEAKPTLGSLRKHKSSECTLRQRPCKYSWIGCQEEHSEKELEEHERDISKHFDQAMMKINTRLEALEKAAQQQLFDTSGIPNLQTSTMGPTSE